jgi:transcription initiation factor TFIIH subunit 1
MATLLVAQVRVKKRDGRAEFSEKGLRWTPDEVPEGGGGAADDMAKPLSVAWTSVQDQQVSSASSPKAMIRLRLTNSVVVVLEFTSDKSLEDAFEIRDQAKDCITRGVAASGLSHKSAAADRTPLCNAAEIKHRAALLAANATLKRQHTEMVNQGLISEEDFWASRRHLIANEASKRQKTGKTSAILTDLSGDNETGGNVVKYNLNAEVIHQIFIQYPAVHLAYKAQVPDKMTETEFWSAFFKSKYFHRDRNKASGHEDMFTRFEEKEQEMAAEHVVDPRGIVDPLVDLSSNEADSSLLKASEASSSRKPEPLNITIAKFNRHGAYVLDPSHAGKLQGGGSVGETLKKSRPMANHDSLKEATLLDDLQAKPAPDYNPLTIEDDSKYFQHKNQAGDATAAFQNLQLQQQLQQTPASPEEARAQFQATCEHGLTLDRAFVAPKTAADVLAEVVAHADSSHDATASSTASLKSGAIAADCIPNDFKKQVYAQFHDVSELLRHFLAFQLKVERGGDADAKHKFKRIYDRIDSKYDELAKIREALPPHEKNLLAPLLKPFDDQLNTAIIAFQKWQRTQTSG